MGNSATGVVECNKQSCEKSYLFEFPGCLHYSFALGIYTFLEIKEVNVSGSKRGDRGMRITATKSEVVPSIYLEICDRNRA
jgi:hypothetical protein